MADFLSSLIQQRDALHRVGAHTDAARIQGQIDAHGGPSDPWLDSQQSNPGGHSTSGPKVSDPGGHQQSPPPPPPAPVVVDPGGHQRGSENPGGHGGSDPKIVNPGGHDMSGPVITDPGGHQTGSGFNSQANPYAGMSASGPVVTDPGGHLASAVRPRAASPVGTMGWTPTPVEEDYYASMGLAPPTGNATPPGSTTPTTTGTPVGTMGWTAPVDTGDGGGGDGGGEEEWYKPGQFRTKADEDAWYAERARINNERMAAAQGSGGPIERARTNGPGDGGAPVGGPPALLQPGYQPPTINTPPPMPSNNTAMPTIMDYSGLGRAPMMYSAAGRVAQPYQGFDMSPVLQYAQQNAASNVQSNAFGEADIWNTAMAGAQRPSGPTQFLVNRAMSGWNYQPTGLNDYMDTAQGALGGANPYDTRMNDVLNGQGVGINYQFDKARENLEHRYAMLNQLGSPAFRSKMQELEAARATQLGNTTASFNMAAAGAEQGIQDARLRNLLAGVNMQSQNRNSNFSNLANAANLANQERQQSFTNLLSAGQNRQQGSQALQGIRSERFGNLAQAGNLGLAATQDREQGNAGRLDQLMQATALENNIVRQKQQDQLGYINQMNQNDRQYWQDYSGAQYQARDYNDRGLQMGLQGLGALSNPLGSAGTAMSGLSSAAQAGMQIGNQNSGDFAQFATNPNLWNALGNAYNTVTGGGSANQPGGSMGQNDPTNQPARQKRNTSGNYSQAGVI
jgi:hypothetical protein